MRKGSAQRFCAKLVRNDRAQRWCAKLVRNSTRSVWRTLVRHFGCAMGARFSRDYDWGAKAESDVGRAGTIHTVCSHSGTL